jgi:hypothetical protein
MIAYNLIFPARARACLPHGRWTNGPRIPSEPNKGVHIITLCSDVPPPQQLPAIVARVLLVGIRAPVSANRANGEKLWRDPRLNLVSRHNREK